MFAEYATLVSSNVMLVWSQGIRPLIDTALGSPLFWPVIVVSAALSVAAWKKL